MNLCPYCRREIETWENERGTADLGRTIKALPRFGLGQRVYNIDMLAPGIHLGAGLRKDLEPGENLKEREIAGQIWVADELIDLRGEDTSPGLNRSDTALSQGPAG